MNLPEAFVHRMKEMPDHEAFFRSYDLPAVKGVRYNSLKVTKEEFERLCPFPLTGNVPWEETGYYTDEEKVGKNIWHAMGLFYSQEPSAMSAVPLLDLKGGERFLDLCSAPGGKGTQAAIRMKGEGIAVLNEKIPDRAKILARNVERMGIRNAIVTNADPRELAKKLPCYFDKILVDAPCSGEGMFKKEENAVVEWSEENVLMCAERQAEILESACALLAEDGTLVYSTCTFSKEEDEGQIERFLTLHPEFELLEEHKLLPHLVKGEGHYVAKLHKKGGERFDSKLEKTGIGKTEEKLYRDFEKKFFNGKQENLYRFGDNLVSLPEGCFSLAGLKVLRAGVPLGTFIKGRFEPDHSFAICYRREDFVLTVDLSEEETISYLRGETTLTDRENGWCVVTCKGYPVGLGKVVGGVVKNHLPKGLRI